MASKNFSIGEHVGHAAMQSMETLRKAGFSEEQSRAQVKSMLCMYDELKSKINDLKSEINSLRSEFSELKSEVRVLADRSRRTELVMIIGFVSIVVTIVVSV